MVQWEPSQLHVNKTNCHQNTTKQCIRSPVLCHKINLWLLLKILLKVFDQWMLKNSSKRETTHNIGSKHDPHLLQSSGRSPQLKTVVKTVFVSMRAARAVAILLLINLLYDTATSNRQEEIQNFARKQINVQTLKVKTTTQHMLQINICRSSDTLRGLVSSF